MKKKFIIALISGILLLVGIETTLYFVNKPKITLNLPNIENLKSINIENKKIEEPEKIKEIIEILSKKDRTTKKASIQDAPINTDETIKIEFHFIEQGTSTLFVYERSNHFYIEQPYNGVYEITESEYNKIKSYGTM